MEKTGCGAPLMEVTLHEGTPEEEKVMICPKHQVLFKGKIQVNVSVLEEAKKCLESAK